METVARSCLAGLVAEWALAAGPAFVADTGAQRWMLVARHGECAGVAAP